MSTYKLIQSMSKLSQPVPDSVTELHARHQGSVVTPTLTNLAHYQRRLIDN